MAQPLNIWMPSGLDVGPNYTLRVTAIDPTTGAGVAGVKSSIVVLDAEVITQNIGDLTQGNWFLVPGPQA